ncbi:hypothetical protein [Arenimonas sp.]|uniref:hypothetical protein n=1 Tax=Arenimonas sp. TaxID=1872635 RepID=UPI0035AFC807
MKLPAAALLIFALPLQAATVSDWSLPAPAGSAQPNLSSAPDGDLVLSWIERRQGGGHRLAFARYDKAGAWSPVGMVAESDKWFVNWADFPALQVLDDGSLWAHVLVKNGDAPYAYDVRLQSSQDGGKTWRQMPPVHDDGTETEHGFATLWPQPGGGLGIAWLDGRHTGGGGHGGHDGHGGAMTLRAAVFNARGKQSDSQLDASTCDCCQTDSARVGDTVLLAYRDRAEGEIRDIAVARFEGGKWQTPVIVHADNWMMPACPVNGPAIAARGDQAWVAWYTAAGGTPALRLAHSDDGGRGFRAPLTLVAGDFVQGRVDVAADGDGVWTAWIEERGGRQSLWLARHDHGLASESLRLKVADLAGRGRGTGFPRLQLRDGQAWLAWTEVVDGSPRLRGARVAP